MALLSCYKIEVVVARDGLCDGRSVDEIYVFPNLVRQLTKLTFLLVTRSHFRFTDNTPAMFGPPFM